MLHYIDKLKTESIKRIDYYNEAIGVAFSTNNSTYVTKNMKQQYWIKIAEKPCITDSFAGESTYIFYMYYTDLINDPGIFRRLNIENGKIDDVKIANDTGKLVNSGMLLAKNIFTIYTKDENGIGKTAIYNQETNKWKWPEYSMESWQRFVIDNICIYPIVKNQLSLVGYDLNTFEPLWKTSLEAYSRYKENLNDTVYNPGRLSDFIGLFGNELILLVTNQVLLAVDITTGVVTWCSEPLTNYFPSFGYKFNAETQQYSFLENHYKQYNIQAIKEAGTLIHTPLWLSSFMVADTDSGYIYAVVEHHILEMNVATKSITVTEIASILPIPKVREFFKIYFSKGLLYISLSVYSIMPTIITVYNPKTKKFVFIHEFKDSVIDVLFFGDNFYVVGSYGDLYEFER